MTLQSYGYVLYKTALCPVDVGLLGLAMVQQLVDENPFVIHPLNNLATSHDLVRPGPGTMPNLNLK
jgi:hypothetical protein